MQETFQIRKHEERLVHSFPPHPKSKLVDPPHLAAAQLPAIVDSARRRVCAPGERVIVAGDRSESMFLICRRACVFVCLSVCVCACVCVRVRKRGRARVCLEPLCRLNPPLPSPV